MRALPVIAVACFTSSLLSAQPNNSSISCIEGIYELQELKADGEIFRPPQVDGRYMVLKGAVLWIYQDKRQSSKQISFAGFGRYTISNSSYSYHYDSFQVYTQTDSGITASNKIPWEGERSYVPVEETDGVHLRNAESRTDFVCSADGLTAGFGQGNHRKYRRLK